MQFKTRFILAFRYQQIEGLKYEETFAPVAEVNFIQAVLSIGAAEHLELDHMVVKTAILNSTLSVKIESIYIAKGWEDWFFRDDKALWVGFKTSATNWDGAAGVKFVGFGFRKLDGDHSICLLAVCLFATGSMHPASVGISTNSPSQIP
jgi:hypothetical protein